MSFEDVAFKRSVRSLMIVLSSSDVDVVEVSLDDVLDVEVELPSVASDGGGGGGGGGAMACRSCWTELAAVCAVVISPD